ncbi:tetratricopeptide repeat-containing diguanylate cyclase [Nitratidesulfovibrio sp. D1]|uniref:tetratricopeptide repeat-containing diguanylate cyclase n=1 Tax=Nitratidesulfovibrio sp. D1 TaxID=3440151 RepID=UPI003EC004C8
MPMKQPATTRAAVSARSGRSGSSAQSAAQPAAGTSAACRPARPEHLVQLNRRDLIAFEHRLRDAMARVLSFKAYSLYFPRAASGPEPLWLPQERKLLVPLLHQGEQLGVFVARGVAARTVRALSPVLPGVAALCLENLQLYKASLTDPVTGLATRQHLLDAIAREVDCIRDCFSIASEGKCDLAAGHRASMGVIAVRLGSLREVARDHGYVFADRLIAALAEELRSAAPEQALPARTGDFEFALFVPAGTSGGCRKLAVDMVRRLRGVTITCGLTDEPVGVAVSAGFAVYPQDMEGAAFARDHGEQARVLLRKARLAAAVAVEAAALSPGDGDGKGDAAPGVPVMGFSRILAEGGRVLETLPLSRVVVSLGGNMNAREGQRFSVWSVAYPVRGGSQEPRQPLYKGEVVLMEVRDNTSLAEIMHVGDPTWPVEPGDLLTLLPEEKGVTVRDGGEAPRTDPLTGLFRHGDFLARWSAERERCDAFSLALVRLSDEGREPEGRAAHPEQLMAEAAQLCRDLLGPQALGGRYGLNSLIFFHPGMTPDGTDGAREVYGALCHELERRLRIGAAVGVACHPYLSYRKADALENCLKALEYAMLLPPPRVGVLDSLALNISADKRYSLGDTFGAIEEYKLALLADETNTMAWNSLGVCMAGLGRHSEARRHFGEALARKPGDPMALYNLGTVCQSEGETAEARDCFRKCLRNAPGHVYALIRLGQLAEGEKRFAQARQYYTKAAKLDGGAALTCRHLARLCMRQGRPDEAREHLHEALLHNPQDAIALQLMARLYLDGGEDPEIAEVMARQSVALRPDLKQGWLELARALQVRGRDHDAREALLRAGER